MNDRMLKVIFAIFLFVAMSHVTFASENETYCRTCHGITVDRHHLLLVNGNYQCTDCHAMKYDPQNNTYYPEVIRNCVTCHAAIDHTCMSCHPQVTSTDLGLHSAMNDSSAVDNGDCTTCHYASFPMVKGAVNNTNTYFCADCHTNAGTGSNKSTIIFTEKNHGEAACIDCHVADGMFHQDNPRGSVSNSTYVGRYTTANTISTDCADCHYAANLDDAPFNAPGGGSHISSVGGSCTTGGGASCHAGGSTLVATIHKLSPRDQGNKPTVTVPTLSLPTVTKGLDVTVNTRVTISSLYDLVDGAQYRIMSGTTEVKSWTSMSAVGGNFGGSSTNATAIIKTDSLNAGAYSIEVRGMAGGPAQDTLKRYYPINGDISSSKSTPLMVVLPEGYINGTIKSGVSALGGAFVSTTGASYTTGSDGTYSLSVPPGTYTVTASKQPVYIDVTVPDVIVTASNTTNVNITMDEKLKGTITGSVTTV